VRPYAPADLWRKGAYAGAWKDRKGNVMRLARVKSLVPSFGREHVPEEEVVKGLDELEKAFKGDEAELAEWRKAWGDGGVGRFFVAKNGIRYYVEFEFKETVKDADAQKMLKAFEKSVSTVVSGGGGISSMKWWESENDLYKFMTDLDKAKGGKFVKDTMRLMDAMRKAYETYVPPQKKVGKCTVRVFRSIDGYRGYLSDNNTGMEWSCGLWDPSREELLVAADDREQALNTMRHEAFHQYLHYATGNGHHATWFNEGHAELFENSHFDRNGAIVFDRDVQAASYVQEFAAELAQNIPAILEMDYEDFYDGDQEEIAAKYRLAWSIAYFLEVGAPKLRYKPYEKLRADYVAALIQTRSMFGATSAVFDDQTRERFIAAWLEFWKRQ
jgi:hypothetical protein